MSDQNLPEGAFITVLSGRRCTAVPKTNAAPSAATSTAAAAASGNNGGGAVGIQSTPTPAANADSSSSVQVQSEEGDAGAATVPEQADGTNEQQQQQQPQQQPQQQTPQQQQPDQAPSPTPAPITPDKTETNPNVVNGNLATTAVGGLNGGAAAVGEGASDPTPTTVTGGGGGRSGAPTAVVAGSVAGGVAVVSIIAFLLWFWRKKAINKRRSSLLTPLTIEPSTFNGGGGNGEKAYVIERGSVGPTPKAEKFKAAVGAKLQGFRGKVGGSKSGPSVDLDRGNSQYMDDGSLHSRSNSSSLSMRSGSKDVVTGKDRFKDWWSRVTADMNFNWRMRNDRTMDADPAAAVRNLSERKGSSQPDFLTLLGMDDKDIQREAQKRQADHLANGSVGSSNHFLGGLNLNFDSPKNPFSDMNALSHDSAKPAPLAVSPRVDPFSDANAVPDNSKTGGIKPPTTYVADVRRSRGLGQNPAPGRGRTPSNAGGYSSPRNDRVDSVYRESVVSVDNFGPKRNKFRSDPFDLERPELLGSRQDLTTATMTSGGGSNDPRSSVNKPKRVHTRTDSYSSKYSSGFSLGDWSDPGPDVGPGSTRWDSPTEGFRPGSRQRGGSDGSVGKAL